MKTPHASHTAHARQRVRLTDRDLTLFGYIGLTGLASQAQLHHAFWPHAKRQTAVDRLARLERAGYLRSLPTSARGARETCYYLTHAVARTLGVRRAAKLRIGAPTATEIAHLLRTRAVLDVFVHTHHLVTFTAERELKREAARAARIVRDGAAMQHQVRQVCDGRIILRAGARSATLLLEIDGVYFGQRLKDKVVSLARERMDVLWVTKSAERAARLQTLCAEYAHIQPIAFADLEQYLHHHYDSATDHTDRTSNDTSID